MSASGLQTSPEDIYRRNLSEGDFLIILLSIYELLKFEVFLSDLTCERIKLKINSEKIV